MQENSRECRLCGHDSTVVEVRPFKRKWLRRRVQCVQCKLRWTTVEVPIEALQFKASAVLSEKELAIVEEYRQGNSTEDIAQRYGVKRNMVSRIARKAGLRKRKQRKKSK